MNYFSCHGTDDDKQVQISLENANKSKSIENDEIQVAMPSFTNKTTDNLESFKTISLINEKEDGGSQIETICLDGHNPSSLTDDTSEESSDDDNVCEEDDWDDFVADEVLDLDTLDLDSERRSILRDVEVMSIIDEEELEELQDSDNINQELPLNVMRVEQNDDLITELTLIKTSWKDEKMRIRDGLKAIKLLVRKQHSEWARRPTKATLARQRKIKEMFPDIVRETAHHYSV